MEHNRAQFTSLKVDYATPKALYAQLDGEFHFTDDPCPFDTTTRAIYGEHDGLARPWGDSTFVNPPYGREIGVWIRRGYEEAQQGKTVVLLIPSRTDTVWWHKYVMKASEIRFIKGRIKFSGAKWNAPFPSAVVVFRGAR
jgi:site-specific DNA-methyltransferase (adenine-specific)